MDNAVFPIDNPQRLKDWISNTAKKNKLVANSVLQNYMMERFLERVSVSKYKGNFILKGGFLIVATFFTLRVNLKLDITTGDVIIPCEVEYSYKLMFEDRSIQVKAYNLATILAEKIESILARNVANTRARDYYDVYILLTTRASDINKAELLQAINRKAEERGTTTYIEQSGKYLADIRESRDLLALWNAYSGKYPYAEDIEFSSIMDCLDELLA